MSPQNGALKSSKAFLFAVILNQEVGISTYNFITLKKALKLRY